MIRGERPIKLGDSWFSTKSIEVEHGMFFCRGRALYGFKKYLHPKQTPNTIKFKYRRQTMGDKIHSLKGNSPDYKIKLFT